MKLRLIALLVLVIAVGGWAQALRSRQSRAQHAADFARIPPQVGVRTGVDETIDAPTLHALQADHVLGRFYRDPRDGSVVELFVAYFGSQATGSQIHSPQHCLPSGGWRILDRSTWEAPTAMGPRAVNEYVIAKGEGKQLVQYWFLTRSGILSNEFGLKWDLVKNSLMGRPTDAAFIRLVLPVGEGGLEDTRSKLRSFCREMLPVLDHAIPIAPA